MAKSRSGAGAPGESLSEGSLGMSGGAGDSGQGAGASSSFPDLTVAGRGTDASSAGSEGGGLRGLEPVGPGKGATEERVGGGTMMAKVQPSDSASRQVEEMRREQAAAAAAGLRDVFFAFDSWTITEEGRMALAHDAEWIKANPGSLIKIEGHCDERGTLAYNLVLGEKRAKAVRNYLVELGVSANRLAVVSYGKERPFCKEHTESCYQQNRRGHLVLRTK
ncbi:MAG: peptidoglycan-associated lipoprotein Pal [Nitrospirota bacterium]